MARMHDDGIRFNHHYSPTEVRALRVQMAQDTVRLLLDDEASALPPILRRRLQRIAEALDGVARLLGPD
jgi:hypothetical protein